jgi:hypothetical protein
MIIKELLPVNPIFIEPFVEKQYRVIPRRILFNYYKIHKNRCSESLWYMKFFLYLNFRQSWINSVQNICM